MSDQSKEPQEQAKEKDQVEQQFGDGDAAQKAAELDAEAAAIAADATLLDDPVMSAQAEAELLEMNEPTDQDAPAENAAASDDAADAATADAAAAAPTADVAADATAAAPNSADAAAATADDADTPAATTAPAAEKPSQPAPGNPRQAHQARREDYRAQRAIERLGRDRAHKVYSWLGFIGGAFAVAWGFMLLAHPATTLSATFRGDFYTQVYSQVAQIGFMLRLGFFGILEAGGLALLGVFGPRIMRDEAREHRHLRRDRRRSRRQR